MDLHRRLTAAALPATLLFPAATAILAAGPRVAAVSPPGASTAHADAYYLYCLFQQSLMQRDYGRALSYLEEASRSDPNAPELAVELGRAYLNMDELDRAETEARRAEALAPALIDGKRLLVDVYKQYVSHTDEVDEGLFTRAAAAYVDLVSADPTDRDTRLGLARLYLGHGLFKQAGEILKAQVAADPESLEAAYLLGETLLRTGDKDEAKKVLADAAGRHPENPDLQRALADSLEASGDLDGALKILNAIVVATPDRPGFRVQLARLFLAMKRYDDAADEANRLLQALEARAADSDREGDQRSAYMLLIEARVAGGKLDDAVAAAQRAEKDFPQETRFTLKRAEILLTMGRDGEAEAIVKSVGSKPGAGDDARAGISEVYFRAGAALERSGDYKKAVALLRQSIESDSGNHAALNYLGYMMADRGDNLEESLDLIQRALRLDDGNGAYLDSLGWVFFRLKRYDQAERPLEQAARAIQDEPVVHDHLGDLYWAVGRSDDAVRAWRDALRLGIEDKDAIQKKIERATPAKPPSP